MLGEEVATAAGGATVMVSEEADTTGRSSWTRPSVDEQICILYQAGGGGT